MKLLLILLYITILKCNSWDHFVFSATTLSETIDYSIHFSHETWSCPHLHCFLSETTEILQTRLLLPLRLSVTTKLVPNKHHIYKTFCSLLRRYWRDNILSVRIQYKCIAACTSFKMDRNCEFLRFTKYPWINRQEWFE